MIKLFLLLLSGAKLGKLFASGGTMLISLVVYAFVFGWRYAAGFVALLLAHEMGHFLAARQRGLAVGLPTFIPFVGAWIDLKEQPRDVETEAYVALAGPLLGTVAAIACYLAAEAEGPRWLMAVAYAGFFLNLFHLLPLAAPQFVKAWKYDPKAPENQSYYAIAPERRFQFLALYFGLAAYLAFMTFRTHELISPAAP